MPQIRAGGEYVTLYEAEKLMNAMLKDYEREVVQPRHEETQGSIGELKSLVQQGSGMLKLGGFMLSVASLVWIVVQIKEAVGK